MLLETTFCFTALAQVLGPVAPQSPESRPAASDPVAAGPVASGPAADGPQGPAAQTEAQQDPARVIRVLSLREWTVPLLQPVAMPVWSFLAPKLVSLLDPKPESAPPHLEPNDLLNLILESVPIDYDAVELSLRGTSLLMAGPPAQLEQITATARALGAAMVHPIEVRATLYRLLETLPLPALATGAELASLTRDLDELWSGRGRCTAGGSVSLVADRGVSYVRDVEVEVALDSKIGYPIVDALFEGVRIAVEPHVLAGTDDLVVLCQVALGAQLAALDSVATAADLPSIDVPHLACAAAAMSARIGDGGALLLSLQGTPEAGEGFLLAVQVTRQPPPAAPALPPRVAIYPVGALLSPALRHGVTLSSKTFDPRFDPDFARPAASDLLLTLSSPDDEFPTDADEILQAIRLALPPDGSSAGVVGGFLVLRGSDAGRDAALRILAGMQDISLRSAAITLETHLVPGAGDADPRQLLHRVVLPVLLGRHHLVVRGRETTVIPDYEVEIAQEAAAANPVVETLFRGVVAAVSIYFAQDALGADFEIYLLHAPPPRRRAADTRQGSDIYLPAIAMGRFAHRGTIPAGRVLDLGGGPTVRVGQREFQTRQTIQVTLPRDR